MKTGTLHDRQVYPPGQKTKPVFRVLSYVVFLLSIGLPTNSYPIEILTNRLDLNCDQTDSDMLACSYRPLLNMQVTGLTASLGDNSLELVTSLSYPSVDSVTAILFMVDTSDPGRKEVISRNVSQIGQMLNAVKSYHIFGLANFDKELNFSVPFDNNKNRLMSAANSLVASGLTTELYRNTIKAIERLGQANADRKVLFLFSDGQAEDKAYFHEDVIEAARRNGVIINSLGFPRSTPLSVALQTLRRLSEETGGVFLEADMNFELPDAFLLNPYANIDRGGYFIIDLSGVEEPVPENPRVEILFETATGNIPLQVPVNLVRNTIAVQQPAIILPAPTAVQAQPMVTTTRQEMGYLDFLLWYGVPIALLVLIILTLITLYLLFRKQQEEKPSGHISYAKIKPLAYLITQDEKAKSYPVTSSTWRIGRSMDNEMTITDNSISRRHAEIQRETNGQFVVYDRGSTNGVYVNNHKISRHLLNEGDIIEIGDVFLRFTQQPGDSQLAESTAMLNTRAPEFN